MVARPKLPDLPFSAPAFTITAGVDEAGRGCLAGPVVAGAVILPDVYTLPGLDDSKAVTPARRKILARDIRACAVAWGLGVVWPWKIDRINILQASLEAMAIAVSCLKTPPQLLLIDGNMVIPQSVINKFWVRRHKKSIPSQVSIIHGDKLVPAISAASILAKTFRDRLMTSLARIWPAYGFERHKGYGVPEHLEALQKFGPCRMHRFSFKHVSNRSLLEHIQTI